MALISPSRRLDQSGAPLRSVHVRASDGAHLYEGLASREGVLVYQTPNGPRRELVTLDALKSMASGLPRSAVTLQHPKVFVTPDNVGRVQVGDVDGEMEIEETDAQGAYARVRVAVRRRDAIDAVTSGVHELSVGYDVVCEETPGVHPVHGPYDAKQISRSVNHLAIVDRGRAGSSVALRVDALVSAPLTQGGSMTPEQIQALVSALVPALAGPIAAEVIKKLAESEKAEQAAMVDANKPAATVAPAVDMVPKAEMTAKVDGLTAEITALRARVDAYDLEEVDALITSLGVKTDAKDLQGKRAAVASHVAKRKVDAADAAIPGLILAAKASAPVATGDRYAGDPARVDGTSPSVPNVKSIAEARKAAGGAK